MFERVWAARLVLPCHVRHVQHAWLHCLHRSCVLRRQPFSPLGEGLVWRTQNLKDQEAIAAELAAAEERVASTPRGMALLRRCAYMQGSGGKGQGPD